MKNQGEEIKKLVEDVQSSVVINIWNVLRNWNGKPVKIMNKGEITWQLSGQIKVDHNYYTKWLFTLILTDQKITDGSKRAHTSDDS